MNGKILIPGFQVISFFLQNEELLNWSSVPSKFPWGTGQASFFHCHLRSQVHKLVIICTRANEGAPAYRAACGMVPTSHIPLTRT